MAADLLARIKQSPVLCDGAMGTLLYANGIFGLFVLRYGMGATFFLTFIAIFAISGAIGVWLLAPFSSRIRGRSMPRRDVRPSATARDRSPDLLLVGDGNSRGVSA